MRQISERLGEGPQKETAQSTAARSPLAPPGRSHSSSRGHGGDSSKGRNQRPPLLYRENQAGSESFPHRELREMHKYCITANKEGLALQG